MTDSINLLSRHLRKLLLIIFLQIIVLDYDIIYTFWMSEILICILFRIQLLLTILSVENLLFIIFFFHFSGCFWSFILFLVINFISIFHLNLLFTEVELFFILFLLSIVLLLIFILILLLLYQHISIFSLDNDFLSFWHDSSRSLLGSTQIILGSVAFDDNLIGIDALVIKLLPIFNLLGVPLNQLVIVI